MIFLFRGKNLLSFQFGPGNWPFICCGVEQLVARLVHTQEVAGSSPAHRNMALVAQLVRAPASYAGGWEFKSLLSHQHSLFCFSFLFLHGSGQPIGCSLFFLFAELVYQVKQKFCTLQCGVQVVNSAPRAMIQIIYSAGTLD